MTSHGPGRGLPPLARTATWCPVHSKFVFARRRLARAAIRQLCDHGMREYRCNELYHGWHIGHLPRDVVAGARTIDQPRAQKRRRGVPVPMPSWTELGGRGAGLRRRDLRYWRAVGRQQLACDHRRDDYAPATTLMRAADRQRRPAPDYRDYARKAPR